MKLKEFISDLVFYISVPKCASCNERLLRAEHALCAKCLDAYNDNLLFNCSLCARFMFQCDCSTPFLKKHYMHKLIKVFRYVPEESNPANMLIYKLKRQNRSDVSDFLSEQLLRSIKLSIESFDGIIVTNVPRRRSSIKKYGMDHSAVLAKKLAKALGCEYRAILYSKAKKAQKKNRNREERLKNAQFDYLRSAKRIDGVRVLLVDDIVTTGASIGAASDMLHKLGAKEIIGATLSVAYKDPYIPFERTK